jgi:hypothetical protein
MPKKIILALLLACGTAQAAEWVSINTSDNGKTENFVDLSSIRIPGQVRWVWIKAVYAPHTYRGEAEAHAKSKWLSDEVQRFAFNCADETVRMEALTVHYTDGSLDVHYTDGSLDLVPAEQFPTSWSPVEPDTVRSVQMQFICAWKPK